MTAPLQIPGRTLYAWPLILALALPGPALAQKPALDHDAYDIWKTIRGERISFDGDWVLYRLTPRVGDATLVVTATTADGPEQRFDRVADAAFTHDARFAVFTVRPAHDSIRALRLKKTPRADLPPDTLGIFDLAAAGVTRIGGVHSWKLPEREGGVIAYMLRDPPAPDTLPVGGTDAAPEAPSDTARAKAGEGRTLVLRNLATGDEQRIGDVVDYAFDEHGTVLAYTVAAPDSAADGVYLIWTTTGESRAVLTGPGRYTQLAVAGDGSQLAFLSDRGRSDADHSEFHLYHWRAGRDDARRIAGSGLDGVPAGWWVSEHGAVRFSESGRRVFFGTSPRPPVVEEQDALLDEEKVHLDVWHWQDDHLQPMQLVNVEEERERTYEAVVHLDQRDRIVQLASEALPTVVVGREGDAELALAETDVPYRALVGIEAPGFSDLWLIDVRTGDRRRVLEHRQVAAAALSPEGRYLAWYDYADRRWEALETRRDRRIPLGSEIPYPLWDETYDQPMHPQPYGQAGWTDGDRELLVYDRYDIWALDSSGRGAARRITDGLGRERAIRLRYVQLDPRQQSIPRTEPMLLAAIHDRTKDAGFFLDRVTGSDRPAELLLGPKRYSRPVRAEGGSALLYTREDVAEFPDIWVADPGFASPRRISHANPQQADYNWATVEQVEWLSNTGVPLQGLLYKPEDFDASRSYPMMVYFYDRQSDNLHQHTPPLPHRSVIRPTFYASRGYIVFMPDIVYQEGYPGKSAMDAVMPGVLMVADQRWVDRENVGIQGHSWGGYQIAYMITRTPFFKAAGAGAPVANMTSAYGGIRWETGLSRVFQYERTQSRIGGSLWDQPLRYIDNSPLFALDRVETPVLIMHNEDDGHVPWEQGIELFVGLRRLGKPAWLINYNRQPHWPITAANMRDWNIRMQQFFDHFLKGAPPPVWLVDGIPATAKGRDLGLDLLDGTVQVVPRGEHSRGGAGRRP